MLAVVAAWLTVRMALAVPPVPPSVDVTAPLTLFLAPVVVPTTSTLTVHAAFAATPPPLLNVSVPAPGAGAHVPPHVVLAFAVFATCKPAGRASVKPRPLRV